MLKHLSNFLALMCCPEFLSQPGQTSCMALFQTLKAMRQSHSCQPLEAHAVHVYRRWVTLQPAEAGQARVTSAASPLCGPRSRARLPTPAATPSCSCSISHVRQHPSSKQRCTLPAYCSSSTCYCASLSCPCPPVQEILLTASQPGGSRKSQRLRSTSTIGQRVRPHCHNLLHKNNNVSWPSLYHWLRVQLCT